MKTSTFILILLSLPVLISCNTKSIEREQSVNAVIGDRSFLDAFHKKPNAETNEVLRIQTHLQYVEKLLRQKDVSQLTHEQQKSRLKMLNLLNQYWTAGNFPKNFNYPDQRKPCFIDQEGNICAVGYLIEQTAGRQIAEEINAKYKNEYLLAMKDEKIENWMHSSGLTKEELAMIQPTYGYPSSQNPSNISAEYGIPSAFLSGINVSLSTVNGINISKGATNKTVPIIGLITGVGQITMGVLNYPEPEMTINGLIQNTGQRNLSLLNIGIGTSALILSSWNLLSNRKPKDKALSWNIYSFPTGGSNVGLGVSFTKRL